MYVVPGNHDIGFHYRSTTLCMNMYLTLMNLIIFSSCLETILSIMLPQLCRMVTRTHLSKRFEKYFNLTGVKLLNLKGNV